MKTIIAIIVLFSVCSPVFAQQTTIRPMFPEWAMGQGGTYQNPYTYSNPQTGQSGTISPMFPDYSRGQPSRMSPGSYSNPYVISPGPQMPYTPRQQRFR